VDGNTFYVVYLPQCQQDQRVYAGTVSSVDVVHEIAFDDGNEKA